METLRIKCITWNVQTSWPEEDMSTLLGLKDVKQNMTSVKKCTPPALPDIYIISLQEVKSQPQNVVLDMFFEEPWTKQFLDDLSAHNYVRIAGERLQGCVLNIIVKKELVAQLRDIHTSVTRTGFGGLWGNKGGVSVRFSVGGCSVCSVNCHLAAHDGGYSERVLQYNTILHSTTFPQCSPTTSILYHDYVFWMGDLNFRLASSISGEEIARLVSKGSLEELYELDELKKAQSARDAFEPLTEAPLTFPPTYKYKENHVSDYDLSRRPAWTDRILHQVLPDAYEHVKLSAEQTSYSALQQYRQSDHKPVIAEYLIKVFSDHRERCVRLQPTGDWRVCEGGTATVSLDSDVVVSNSDYIALFKDNFCNMEQYITYCYLPEIKDQSGPATFTVALQDDLIHDAGMYRLVYVSRLYNCYLGMSDAFAVQLSPQLMPAQSRLGTA
ncbi:phosphatidylinositol 4,5-bisphosphate 5-phosphatase A [Hyalella azteca]|uniref:Phosphatidylinositol 4,5-bisphosphate 5-phosphatase A n=2 Tax=Hyalella azteca TaxID=294128 RepID=A0A979FSK4_HYAAZ|nr:phosphatidylinositol 4,5-bisphosphate 5-phosphatase A [Hyalella azteca]